MREVNISKIQLELSEYSAYDNNINKKDTKQAVKIAKKTTAKLKPVVKKLTKKIMLKQTVAPEIVAPEIVAPEIAAIEIAAPEIVVKENEPVVIKPKKPAVKGRKKLIIHDA